jgi:hypothetical protein
MSREPSGERCVTSHPCVARAVRRATRAVGPRLADTIDVRCRRSLEVVVWSRGDDLFCVASKEPGATKWDLRVEYRSRLVRRDAFQCFTRALRAAQLWRVEFGEAVSTHA